MALDTQQKRASGINVSSPWRGLLPLPDGTIGQADREQAAFQYAGILYSASAFGDDLSWFVVKYHRRPRRVCCSRRR